MSFVRFDRGIKIAKEVVKENKERGKENEVKTRFIVIVYLLLLVENHPRTCLPPHITHLINVG